MNFYKLLAKPLLFCLKPESAHKFVFGMLKLVFGIPGIRSITRSAYAIRDKRLHRNIFGLDFPNPVGLAAGFDKDARLFKELSSFGFGFIEVGTVTPLPQEGNPKPRMFRLPDDEALINRMGFNNEGVVAMARRLKKKNNIILGVNIGKNKLTSIADANMDYEICFRELFPYADYFAVNVSSPNTPGLRALQEKKPLLDLLMLLQNVNVELSAGKSRQKPLLLKIAPDLSEEQLADVVEVTLSSKIDGIIAVNTTLSREGLQTPQAAIENAGAGGVSGKPLNRRSTEVIRYLKSKSQGRFKIIGVGGIHSAEDAIEKLKAGADLVQVYTGFIYEGPSLVRQICKKLI